MHFNVNLQDLSSRIHKETMIFTTGRSKRTRIHNRIEICSLLQLWFVEDRLREHLCSFLNILTSIAIQDNKIKLLWNEIEEDVCRENQKCLILWRNRINTLTVIRQSVVRVNHFIFRNWRSHSYKIESVITSIIRACSWPCGCILLYVIFINRLYRNKSYCWNNRILKETVIINLTLNWKYWFV